MRRHTGVQIACLFSALAGCGPARVESGDGSDTTAVAPAPTSTGASDSTTSGHASSDPETQGPGPGTSTSTSDTTSDDATSVGGGGGGEAATCEVFSDAACPAVEPGIAGWECNFWNDECPASQKCWWNPDGDDYGSCVDLAEQAGGFGEPCEEFPDATGSSMRDTCDRDFVCLEGICLRAVRCSPDHPVCLGGDDLWIEFSTLRRPCLPRCDPAQPDCPAQWLCRPFAAEGFACQPPPVIGGDAEVGDALRWQLGLRASTRVLALLR